VAYQQASMSGQALDRLREALLRGK
jgi:hypothetical protein